MFKVDGLKQRGNDAFKKRQFDEALKCYDEAIQLAKSSSTPDTKVLVILFSNTAQTYLELKQFGHALQAANQSLEYDSDFKKSQFRRALANFELGNIEDAEKEARFLIASEPKNVGLLRLLRRIHPVPKLYPHIQRALIQLTLQKAISRPLTGNFTQSYNNKEQAFWRHIQLLIQRFVLLSSKSAQHVSLFLEGSRIMAMNGKVALLLPPWFPINHMRYEPGGNQPTLEFSRKAFDALMAVAKPRKMILMFNENSYSNQNSIGLKYEFNEAIYMFIRNIDPNYPSLQIAQCIKQASMHLTQLPYFKGIHLIPNIQFPKINSIVSIGSEIDIEFLKFWKKSDWPVRKLIFNEFPKIKSFERFNGIISNQLTDLHLSMPEIVEAPKIFNKTYSQLNTFKRVFPQLKNITVSFVAREEYDQSDIHHLYAQLPTHFFILQYFNKKPDWCEKFRVLSEQFIFFGSQPNLYQRLREILEAVVELREERFSFGSQVKLHGPKPSSFVWASGGCSFAIIEATVNGIDYEVVFNPNYAHEM